MSEVLSLTKPEVLKLEMFRNEETRFIEAKLQIEDSGQYYFITLVRPNDMHVLTELFEAESVWATKNTDAGLEYGKCDLFILNECTYDTSVDEIVINVENANDT